MADFRGKAKGDPPGYKCRGKTAETEASRTLRKPQVAAYFQKLKKQAADKAKLSAAKILQDIERAVKTLYSEKKRTTAKS